MRLDSKKPGRYDSGEINRGVSWNLGN